MNSGGIVALVAWRYLKYHIGISSTPTHDAMWMWSQIVTSSRKHCGPGYRLYALTEPGVAMLVSSGGSA